MKPSMPATRLYPVYEFYKGFQCVHAGKTPDGKPRVVMVIETLRVMNEGDARAMVKAYPGLAARGRKVMSDKSETWPKKTRKAGNRLSASKDAVILRPQRELASADTKRTDAIAECIELVDALRSACDTIDRDRSGLAEALAEIVERVSGATWIIEGRGPYAWDDDRYKEETGRALRGLLDIAQSALRNSGTRANDAYPKARAILDKHTVKANGSA